MKTLALCLGLILLPLISPPASADPSCSDYASFLECIKQRQGTWQDCRQWHCEGGTSPSSGTLIQEAQAGCAVGPCESVGVEPNSVNCQANSVPRPARIVRILVNGEYHRARICGERDCQFVRESLARESGCGL